jgi:hypothetical protein
MPRVPLSFVGCCIIAREQLQIIGTTLRKQRMAGRSRPHEIPDAITFSKGHHIFINRIVAAHDRFGYSL